MSAAQGSSPDFRIRTQTSQSGMRSISKILCRQQCTMRKAFNILVRTHKLSAFSFLLSANSTYLAIDLVCNGSTARATKRESGEIPEQYPLLYVLLTRYPMILQSLFAFAHGKTGNETQARRPANQLDITSLGNKGNIIL